MHLITPHITLQCGGGKDSEFKAQGPEVPEIQLTTNYPCNPRQDPQLHVKVCCKTQELWALFMLGILIRRVKFSIFPFPSTEEAFDEYLWNMWLSVKNG